MFPDASLHFMHIEQRLNGFAYGLIWTSKEINHSLWSIMLLFTCVVVRDVKLGYLMNAKRCDKCHYICKWVCILHISIQYMINHTHRVWLTLIRAYSLINPFEHWFWMRQIVYNMYPYTHLLANLDMCNNIKQIQHEKKKWNHNSKSRRCQGKPIKRNARLNRRKKSGYFVCR